MISKKIIIILILYTSVSFSQYNGNSFMIGINGVYTTSAKIYLYPYSSDAVLRNTSFPLSDIINPGLFFRYRLTDDLIIGFNTEYMKKTSYGKNLTVFSNDETVTINVKDGFIMVPFELSLYYLLPFSTEDFKFLMGGGGAYYYGKQIRNFGNAGISSSETHIAYGIQVSVSMDYLITNHISIRGAMKFRDPQFTVKNVYNRKVVDYNGSVLNVLQSSFTSKVNVDGVTFILGAAYSF